MSSIRRPGWWDMGVVELFWAWFPVLWAVGMGYGIGAGYLACRLCRLVLVAVVGG